MNQTYKVTCTFFSPLFLYQCRRSLKLTRSFWHWGNTSVANLNDLNDSVFRGNIIYCIFAFLYSSVIGVANLAGFVLIWPQRLLPLPLKFAFAVIKTLNLAMSGLNHWVRGTLRWETESEESQFIAQLQ